MNKLALFTSYNLIGDGLYIGPALRAWHKCNPEFDIDIRTNLDHITSIYSQMGVPVRCVLTGQLVADTYNFTHVFDVNKAFALSDKKRIHVAEAYAELLDVTLTEGVGPFFEPVPEQIEEREKGLVLVSMFSASCTSRDKSRPGLPPNKMLPWAKWEPILNFLWRKFGEDKVMFIGAPDDRADGLPISEDRYMTGIPLNRLALIMRAAKMVVTLDNGMAHLAASQKVNEVVFYPACLGLHYITPKGNPNCYVIHMDPMATPGPMLSTSVQLIVNRFPK